MGTDMKDKLDLESDLTLNFEEDKLNINDFQDGANQSPFTVSQSKKADDVHAKQNSDQIKAGLPTILENSGTADL